MSNYDVSYTYDNRGNRLTRVDNLTSAGTEYTYDAANELLQEKVIGGAVVNNYTYDPNGNRTSKASFTGNTTYYTWDPLNRLRDVTLLNDSVQFQYNAPGQLVEKDSPVATKRFVYDFQRQLLETDAAGSPVSYNTWRPNEYGDLVSEHYPGNGQSYFHLYDGLGSTSFLAPLTGGMNILLQSSSAFGTVLPIDSGGPYTWVGQKGYFSDSEFDLYDRALDLCFMGMGGNGRPYEPGTGRFLTPDRIFDDPNPYRYARNNPANKIDPSGEVSVVPIANRNRLNIGCGQDALVYWDFILDRPAPCLGWIVQKVTSRCQIADCSDPFRICPRPGLPIIDSIYWEAWPVAPGDWLAVQRRQGDSYTDGGRATAENNRCGLRSAQGIIKFFCESPVVKIGDPAGGWFMGGTVYGLQCRYTVGQLWATTKKPIWWDNPPSNNERVASRHGSLWWNCCGGCCDFVDTGSTYPI